MQKSIQDFIRFQLHAEKKNVNFGSICRTNVKVSFLFKFCTVGFFAWVPPPFKKKKKKKVPVELGHQQNEEQVITHHLCFQSRSSLPAVVLHMNGFSLS